MKKTNLFSLLFLIAFGSIFFVACTEENDDPEPTDTLTGDEYTYDVHTAPIFTNMCATSGCHTSGAAIGSLANYADAKDFTQRGRVMGSIKHEAGFSPMPKNAAKVSDQIIETIQQWIDDGYLEKI